MTSKTGESTVAEYQGKPLSPAIPYSYDYSVYDTLAEAKESQDWPSEGAILKWINQTAERAAKAKAYQSAVKDLKAEYEQTREYRVKQLASAIATAQNIDAVAALALAEQMTPAE